MQFPQIKIGKQTHKKSKFNMDHNAVHSCDFGHVSCLSLVEMNPKDEAVVETNNLVRMTALLTACTTDMKYQIIHRFVPTSDLYEPYENLYAGQSYGTGVKSYLPTSQPVISSKNLAVLLFNHGWVSMYKYDADVDQWELLPNTYDTTSAQFNGYCDFFNIGSSIISDNQLFPKIDPPFDVYLDGMEENQSRKMIQPDGADFILTHDYHGTEYMWCIRLDNVGLRIRDCLLGLGYQIDPTDSEGLNALPIFAFCKAYFDTFYPQQNITWTNTDIYQLLDYIRINNVPDSFEVRIQSWIGIMDFIGSSFFTDNQDFVSAHISTLSKSVSNTLFVSGTDDPEFTDSISNLKNGAPYIEDSLDITSASGIRALLKLNTYVNIATNVGGRIAEFLKVMTGSDELHNKDSYFIGNDSVQIQVEDVNQMTDMGETEGYYLGQYAGKGVGYNQSNKSHKFTAPCKGYWVMLYSVVPTGSYFQGIAPYLYHRTKMEEYQPMFDGLGYEVTNRGRVFADNAVANSQRVLANLFFGLIPQYSSFKYHNDIIGGQVSLRSSKSNLLPFVLPKYITPDEFTYRDCVYIPGNQKIMIDDPSFKNSNIPIASTEWRFVNKYKYLANYQHIFPEGVLNAVSSSNLTLTDDPFFIFSRVKVTLYSHMKPIAESFDTDGEGDAIEVQKA